MRRCWSCTRSRPEYGFDRHKGYPTPEHLEALRRHGVSQFHRRTFAPVRLLLVQRRCSDRSSRKGVRSEG